MTLRRGDERVQGAAGADGRLPGGLPHSGLVREQVRIGGRGHRQEPGQRDRLELLAGEDRDEGVQARDRLAGDVADDHGQGHGLEGAGRAELAGRDGEADRDRAVRRGGGEREARHDLARGRGGAVGPAGEVVAGDQALVGADEVDPAGRQTRGAGDHPKADCHGLAGRGHRRVDGAKLHVDVGGLRRGGRHTGRSGQHAHGGEQRRRGEQKAREQGPAPAPASAHAVPARRSHAA